MILLQVRICKVQLLKVLLQITSYGSYFLPPSLLTVRCPVDERNLLYVAVTRATHYVILSAAAVDVLCLAKEYPVLHCMPSSVAKSSDTVSKPLKNSKHNKFFLQLKKCSYPGVGFLQITHAYLETLVWNKRLSQAYNKPCISPVISV